MNLEDLNELDFNNMGDWPMLVKALLIAIVCALLVVGGYFFLVQEQYDKLSRVEREEKDLREQYERKHVRSVNLDALKAQLVEMEESFGAMLRQLPDRTEVADLLVDVSQTGLASGLKFELFQPQGEVPREFYAELPIKLRVTGTYHQFGEFVSGLAALPRIVTIHDVELEPLTKGGGSELVLNATAKTYRYLDGEG